MKNFIITLIFIAALFFGSASYAQDGSNIMYSKVDQLDSSFMGTFVHLYFYNKSFGGRKIDTIIVEIEGYQQKFIEHRKDNGFNNWFQDQYLESLDKVDGELIRIVRSRLDKITNEFVFVTNYLDYYDENNKLVKEKSRELPASFPRAIIAEVLISAEHYKERVK